MSRTKLIQQAARVRDILQQRDADMNAKTTNLLQLPPPSSYEYQCQNEYKFESKQLYFPSSYSQNYGTRGFSNWLIPNHVMIGQYPGMTPEKHGPQEEEVKMHMHRLLKDARIRTFCSLQSEVPSQDDFNSWDAANGRVQLPMDGGRDDFPKYFTHYAPLVELMLAMNKNTDADDVINARDGDSSGSVSYVHAPILDLNTPSSASLVSLLSAILTKLECENAALYIHCWGGRGRAGLVGSCLLSLLFPELDAKDCLDLVQKGYDTRDGALFMPLGLRMSPQTSSQRNFVMQFVADFRQ
jgi:alanine transaminase